MSSLPQKLMWQNGVQFQTERMFNLSGQTVQFDPAYSVRQKKLIDAVDVTRILTEYKEN